MRILQIIDSLGFGGAEVLLKGMAPLFRTRGVDCDVVTLLRTGSSLENALQAEGVPLSFTDSPKLYSPRQILSLAKLMRGYDVIHVHLFPAQLWAVLAAAFSRSNVPLVSTEHNTWNRRRDWPLRRFDRWMYSHYRQIACNSEATAEELVRWCPHIAARIRVIPNGIPIRTFEDAEPVELPDIPSDAARIIFVGRFEPQKDHATVLRALPSVSNAHLLLVGDGPLRPQLQQMAHSLGIADRITFLGWRNDIAGLLKASHLYVHSTTSDGFGIAACEAMAAGLPILASNVPGLAQVVEGPGVLFPVGNENMLARELTALIQSPDRRLKMSQASRQRAQQFSIDRTVDACIQMYVSVLGVSPPTLARHYDQRRF